MKNFEKILFSALCIFTLCKSKSIKINEDVYNTLIKKVFEIPNTGETYPINSEVSKEKEFRAYESCQHVCVEHHLCVNGMVITNGAELLRPKTSKRNNDLSNSCAESETICCLLENSEEANDENGVDENKTEITSENENEDEDESGDEKENDTHDDSIEIHKEEVTEPATTSYVDEIDEDRSRNEVPIEFSCGYRYIDTNSNLERRISGGGTTHLGEFPWVIAILMKITSESDQSFLVYQGGGSLIHPKVVLTAAHILNSRGEASFVARAGEYNMQQETEIYEHQDRFVSNVIVHKNYQRSTLINDIALLIINEPFQLTITVNTICLPPLNLKIEPNTICIASGWGKISFDRADRYQPILKKVNLPIIASNECEQSFRNTRLGRYYRLHHSFVCAGGKIGEDTCKGDGGIPLICQMPNDSNRHYQTGIVAGGIECASSLPGLYANVPIFTDWILTQMKLLNIDLSPNDTLRTEEFLNIS